MQDPKQITVISPKQVFASNPEAVKNHRAIVDSPAFPISVSIALAELARMSLSAEQLKGANAFIDTFTFLAEKESDTRANFPTRTLTP